jgi:beta-mannosidase
MLATSHKRVAFRHAQVVQDPLEGQEGTTFLFEVNGVRVFCGGSNWIPADSFLTEIEPGRYRRWMNLLVSTGQLLPGVSLMLQVEGNHNMLRIWGGGVYENEELYKWVFK